MFTGIIEEKGTVKVVNKKGSHTMISVGCGKVQGGIETGDSVAVNGVCLTVTGVGKDLTFDVVGNTLDNTNLKRLRAGTAVNLESAMKAGDKISGHMVTGHIDGERVIRKNVDTPKGRLVEIGMSPEDRKYLVAKGSVAVDGISLTVAEVEDRSFRVYLIPLTLESTTLKLKKPGEHVNVEFDIMAKYNEKAPKSSGISRDFLRSTGFMD